MFVVHVSDYYAPELPVVRVVVGCENIMVDLASTFNELGYNTWETEEPEPTRSDEEKEQASVLVQEAYAYREGKLFTH